MFDELSEKRLEICRKCPLYKEDEFSPICDNKKYISRDGKDWSYFPKKGYVKGCNCRLNSKVKNPSNHCIIKLW